MGMAKVGSTRDSLKTTPPDHSARIRRKTFASVVVVPILPTYTRIVFPRSAFGRVQLRF